MEYIVLALIQGLTEFLPISSSGHLFLLPQWFDWEDPGLGFSAILHLGTLFAVLLYFWKEWIEMAQSFFINKEKSKKERYLLWMIMIATIPGALVGFFLEDVFEVLFREVWIVALFILIGSLVLWRADRYISKKESHKEIGLKEAIFIGMSQVLALFPGISRSGITIATGLFLGISRRDSAKFSFLLATPIILGASILSFGEVWKEGLSWNLLMALFVSFVSAYIVIAWMLRWIEKVKYSVFVWYGISLSLFAFLWEIFF